jgi:hypothetical protein
MFSSPLVGPCRPAYPPGRSLLDQFNSQRAELTEDEGELIASADLLKLAGDSYEFLPNAEMDDMQTVVLPVGSTVSVIAGMKIHTGTRNKHGGEPDVDENATSTVVHIAP